MGGLNERNAVRFRVLKFTPLRRLAGTVHAEPRGVARGREGFEETHRLRLATTSASRRWYVQRNLMVLRGAAHQRVRRIVHAAWIVFPNPHVQLIGRERRTAPIRNALVFEHLIAEHRRAIVSRVPR